MIKMSLEREKNSFNMKKHLDYLINILYNKIWNKMGEAARLKNAQAAETV